ncbi:Protein Croc-4 [Manis pentadactyla]|nr:Protein Croc-4 [Manis pentadactyla]
MDWYSRKVQTMDMTSFGGLSPPKSLFSEYAINISVTQTERSSTTPGSSRGPSSRRPPVTSAHSQVNGCCSDNVPQYL